MLDETEFKWQLRRLRGEYRDDNAWVQRWAGWNDDERMDWFIDCAYQLYRRTATNTLQMTVLGGTAIRMDESLIQSFGVTGVTGIQDGKTKGITYREMIRRLQRSVEAAANGTDDEMAPVTQRGSILSERGWSPILNDALLVGAMTSGQEFLLGLTQAERTAWNRINADKVTKFGVRSVAFDQDDAKEAWREFLASRRRMFFDRFTPRVFTREVLGLCFFGYEPEFSWHQLRFRPGPAGVHPDFATYLRKLRDTGFTHPTDKPAVLATISEFLFGEEDALTRRAA
ncbi:MAG: hypothetical protein NXI31_01585 [bacterium]|nr:hypothetical protein [bacterium]